MYFLFRPSEAASILDIDTDRYRYNKTLERLWKIAGNTDVEMLDSGAPAKLASSSQMTSLLLGSWLLQFPRLPGRCTLYPSVHAEHKQLSNGKRATHSVIRVQTTRLLVF
jgi:hypothetical protein